MKRLHALTKWDLLLKFKDGSTDENPSVQTYYVNRMKGIKHLTFLIDAEKAFHKNQHPFLIKIQKSF